MRKKENYTHITPIPSYIPRQLAIDILHSHGEIITINPLVINYEPIKAPRDAPADEFYSTWYEIEQRIQFVPGAGKMGSGKIKFNGCFHDLPWGLQTHIYAPMKVDMRNKWRIAGNQPGEPREPVEMGIGAPPDGLYLREDVEIKCNITMMSFVKKEAKAASKILVDRLIKKAELLEEGVLQAMMENGRLKTHNPADRSGANLPPLPSSPSPYARMPHSPMQSPYNKPLPVHPVNQVYQPATYPSGETYVNYQHGAAIELPADDQHLQYPQDHKNAHLRPVEPHPADRHSAISELSGNSPATNDGRWSSTASDYQPSATSRPTSYATDTSGMKSPRFENAGFPPTRETKEEHEGRRSTASHELEDKPRPRYNPQDYVNT